MTRELRMTLACMVVVSLAVGGAGCGGDDDDATAPSKATTPATTAPVPTALGGTWKVKLKRSELADAPDDLRAKTSDWTLEFRPTGGEKNGPSMVVTNTDVGEVVNPISLAGEQITLEFPTDCRVYAYAVEGDELSLTSTEADCPRDAVSSVLTARPWRR